MSKKNANKLMEQYFMGIAYYNKKDRLRLDGNEIYNQGTIMAYIHEDTRSDDEYCVPTYMITTLQDYKSQKTWKQDKKDLIEIAVAENMRIIFVPELDIGFGFNTKAKSWYDRLDINFVMEQYLIKAAKFSKEDIKTAVAAIIPGYGRVPDEVIGIAYNQRDISGDVIHAEKILCDYIDSLSMDVEEYIFVSLLEPCEDCLRAMLDCNASEIYYSYLHKDKWNTTNYIQLVNDIDCKEIRHAITKIPIKYKNEFNNKVHKFINKGIK